jgi:hypothetical protein
MIVSEPDLEARITALEGAGWALVHEDSQRHVPALFRFERQRPFNGTRISEQGSTLEQAISSAEWQEERLSALEDRTTEVQSGLGSG